MMINDSGLLFWGPPCTSKNLVPYTQGWIIHEAGETEASGEGPGPQKGRELPGTTEIFHHFWPRNFYREKLQLTAYLRKEVTELK